MKSFPYYLFLILWLLMSLNIHPQWQWQNPWPTGNHLFDVWMFNDSTIIADGTGGSFLLTDNGGESWTELQMTDYRSIVGLMFVNNQTGFAIGNGKNTTSLLKTDDSGQNWTDYTMPTNLELSDLFFINEEVGWAVGEIGKIYKTTDGGLSWQDQSLGIGLNLFSVFFADSMSGWTVGQHGLIANTSNGGNSWNYSILNNSEDLTSIVFTNPDSGWITGATGNWRGTILATTDGGINWNPQFTTSNSDPIIYIFPLNSQKLWACSNAGKFLKTVNGGLNWTVTPSDTIFSLNSIFFINAQLGYCVGHVGRIFQTNDGGDNWEKLGKSATYAELRAIKMVDDNTGWSVGNNGVILKTNDGGLNWISQAYTQPQITSRTNFSINFNSLVLINEMNIWAVGNIQDSTSNTQGLITYTHDDGQTWNSIVFYDNDGFLDIDFANDSIGWALAWESYDRILYKTTDGGQDWTVIWIAANSTANKIDFINEDTGWMCSLTTDTLLKTTDGGTNWSSQVIGFPYGIGDTYFSDEQQGWVAGGYEIFGIWPLGGEGYIFHTTDGGNSWLQQEHVIKDMFIGIDMFDNLYGTAVGYNGTIYHTEDGGLNWNAQKSTILWTINDVDFINSQKGWICGSFGSILYTSTGGTTPIYEPPLSYSIPENVVLFQNYPNPFNHTTTIEFSISQSGKVKIEIFNVLGERVNILLDEYLIPGKYEVNWNGLSITGETVSSGVYFYRVESITPSGKFSKTRKLIFMK